MRSVSVLLLVVAGIKCYSHIVDLGYGYDKNASILPGFLPFRYIGGYAGSDRLGVWFAVNDFQTNEHIGTHLDAPFHFNKKGRDVSEIPVERLLTRAILLNVSDEVCGNPAYKLPVKELKEWEKSNGKIKRNTVLFVDFGWSYKYPNKKEYLGSVDRFEDLNFPGLSAEAAEWIVKKRKIIGVAVGTASADQGSNTDAHVILTKNDIYIIENVNLNLELPNKFDVIVMPMKLINGTGAPCRVVAIY